MTENILVKLFEHNNWANTQIIQACSALSDEQLDAEPQSATKGTIRRTLVHLVSSQQGYLRTLTLPLEERLDAPTVAFAELQESAHKSGEGLLILARGEQSPSSLNFKRGMATTWSLGSSWFRSLTTRPNIANRSRACSALWECLRQIIDGWDYGDVTKALIPISK